MYQEIFNKYLKQIRLVCNATNNSSLGDSLVKIMFNFSDELQLNNIVIRGEKNGTKNR